MDETIVASKPSGRSIDRVSPHSDEAEISVLGAMLLEETAADRAMEILTEDDFHHPAHRHIFRAASSIRNQGHAPDALAVREELRRIGSLDEAGGGEYLARIVDIVPTAANLPYHARIVQDLAVKRRLIRAGTEIVSEAYESVDDSDQLLNRAEERIFRLSEHRFKRSFTPISQLLQGAIMQLETLSSRRESITGAPTGFKDLDELTAGFQLSDLIIVAGRPSMGKCVAYDTEIVLADGSVATIEEICRRRRARVLTLEDDWRLHAADVSHFVDDGIKPVFRVTTQLGRQVETTLTHPFLTIDGWKPLDEIQVGDRVAVPRELEVFGDDDLPEELLERWAREVSSTREEEPQTRVSRDAPDPYPRSSMLEEECGDLEASSVGALTTTLEIPSRVFTLRRRKLGFFLSQLFAEGGWVRISKIAPPRLGYDAGSERIGRQIQHLLLRFGVLSRLSLKTGAWHLEVHDTGSLREFLGRIGVGGLAHSIQGISAGEEDAKAIYWDEIVRIEAMGLKQVYDLTVPSTHNFIANDVCVHNTSFCLNVAAHAAIVEDLPVAVFSLEMSMEQLVQRLISTEALVSLKTLRTGQASSEQWKSVADACDRLRRAAIYIDDSGLLSVHDMRAKARRLKQQRDIGLVIVDYLQLMESGMRAESRQQEITEISRSLKALAKELNIPVIALSQLSRGPEHRADQRPRLADLRESGCLTGETLVYLSEAGRYRPIGELEGRSGFRVLGLNTATWKLESARVERAFATGYKPVLRLTTRLGRSIRATANHRFLTIDGWKRLDELVPEDRIALPRSLPEPMVKASMGDEELALLGRLIGDGCTLPQHAIQYTTNEEALAEDVSMLAKEMFGDRVAPRVKRERNWYQVYLAATDRLTHRRHNPISSWLRDLGVFGLRSYEKRVPDKVFEQSNRGIAIFLRQLWSTDGCIRLNGRYPQVYYASSSERLARDVQSLLLRLEINAVLRRYPQGRKGRDQYHVLITGKADLTHFLTKVGAVGKQKIVHSVAIEHHLTTRVSNTNRDLLPLEAWRGLVVPAMRTAGMTTRQMQAAIGTSFCGTTLYKSSMGRDRAARVARAVDSDDLARLAASDVYWDSILSIEADGEAPVYDLTVAGLHNFVAADIIVHNSLEQDSDLVLFLYRDEYYNPESTDKKGVAEIIIGKNRNGPTGMIELAFLANFMRFENLDAFHTRMP